MSFHKSKQLPIVAVALAALTGGFATPRQVANSFAGSPAGNPPVITHLSPVELHMMHPCSAWGTGPLSGFGQFSCPTAHLVQYGGPIITNPKLVMVLYGAGTYASYLTNDTAPSMASYYSQMVNSPMFDWLNEYNTSSQSIGHGSYGGKYAITPSSANNGSSITDAQVQAELNLQVNAGHLPTPDSNTIFMVHFRSGQSITNGGGSCVSGGFCAYHGSAKNGASEYCYAVIPDFHNSGCAGGCGGSSEFNNVCSTASHEIIETTTDPLVADASTLSPPLGWYWYSSDSCQGEIGDICNQNQATFKGTDGNTYTIQNEWSNAASSCIASVPLSLTRSVWTFNRSTNAYQQNVTVTNTSSSMVTGPISLVISGATGGTLKSSTGTTGTILPLGSGYINSASSLAAHASVIIPVSFTKVGSAPIDYTLRVVAGPGTR